MNHSKGHKLEGLISVGDNNRSLRRKGVEAPMYSFFHGYFPDIEFFALRHYIHVVEEGPEECLFDPAEVSAYERDVMQPKTWNGAI